MNGSAEVISIQSRNHRMKEILSSLPRIARSQGSVLVRGESGTGKELIAKRIHQLSPRSKAELVTINCAALPEALLEAELFGYKKGAFTGACRDQKGLFEVAHQGSIFLDEIGDMPVVLQAKLLRVLQEKKVRPLGSSEERSVDFRLIAATHRNLKSEVANGKFREDLYYRVGVIPIFLPALRERPEDIPDLIVAFSQRFSKRSGLEAMRFSEEAVRDLSRRHWPGNIRELENFVERLLVLHQGKAVVQARDLPPPEEEGAQGSPVGWASLFSDGFPPVASLVHGYIEFVLSQVGNQSEAARILGLSRRTLCRKLRNGLVSSADLPLSGSLP